MYIFVYKQQKKSVYAYIYAEAALPCPTVLKVVLKKRFWNWLRPLPIKYQICSESVYLKTWKCFLCVHRQVLWLTSQGLWDAVCWYRKFKLNRFRSCFIKKFIVLGAEKIVILYIENILCFCIRKLYNSRPKMPSIFTAINVFVSFSLQQNRLVSLWFRTRKRRLV